MYRLLYLRYSFIRNRVHDILKRKILGSGVRALEHSIRLFYIVPSHSSYRRIEQTILQKPEFNTTFVKTNHVLTILKLDVALIWWSTKTVPHTSVLCISISTWSAVASSGSVFNRRVSANRSPAALSSVYCFIKLWDAAKKTAIRSCNK